MEDSGLMSIPQYVEKQLAAEAMTGATPVEVADELLSYANKSLGQVEKIRRDVQEMSKELRHTLSDIEAMCYLGRYYCWKIRGATELALFEKMNDTDHKNLAIRHLQKARSDWEKYTFVAGKMYRPQLLARTRVLDWMQILEDVKRDVEIAQGSGGQQ